MNLFHGACPRNDDCAGTKDAHGDAFTVSYTGARSLSFTKGRAATYTRALVDSVVEVLGVDSLIDGLFEHAKEIVLFDKDPVEIVLLYVVIELIV